MTLENLGWNDFFAKQLKAHPKGVQQRVGRVTCRQKNSYGINCGQGDLTACISGKMIHQAGGTGDFPVVGDWIMARIPQGGEKGPAVIEAILPRKSVVNRGAAGGRSRKAGGALTAQAIAANIDTIFIVTGLDRDYNLRRIERYLALVYDSGAIPVILLTKADLCDDVAARILEVEAIAFGVPVHAFCALRPEELTPLLAYLPSGGTAALLGSSGVGKSTITNGLLGRAGQKVSTVSADDGKGTHTTTHRELYQLPGGGLILDNPGMREIQLWDDEGGVAAAFEDIAALAEGCRFGDCRHQEEPGCAVREALETGGLDEERFQSYSKLIREQRYATQRKAKSAAAVEKSRWKKISILQKEMRSPKGR